MQKQMKNLDIMVTWAPKSCSHLVQAQLEDCSWGDQFSAAQITQHYRICADLSFLDCSWWNEDLRKCVHGSLDGVTLDAWHRVQDLLCQFGLLSQGVQDRALLLSIRRTHNTGVTKNDDITHINDGILIQHINHSVISSLNFSNHFNFYSKTAVWQAGSGLSFKLYLSGIHFWPTET